MTQTCSYCKKEYESHLQRCPRCGHATNTPQVDASPASEMIAEPDHETSYEIKAVDEKNAASESDTRAFHPVQRPPTAALCVLFDDSQQFGEWHWLRNKQTTIGRSEGDVTIVNDPGMSNPHAQITREHNDGQFHWVLRDLESDNGTFLRIQETILTPNQELLIGMSRLRFSLPDTSSTFSETDDETIDKTRVWRTLSAQDLTKLVPALIETTGAGEERTYPLMPAAENLIGRDAGQANVVLDDLFVDPRHVRIFNDGQQWICQDKESTNGTWLRITEAALVDNAEFQLSEQRFRLHFRKT